MSNMTDLQNMIFRPRDETGGAKTQTGARSTGADGKQYAMVDDSDIATFNVMTEDELRAEAAEAQETANDILQMGRSKAMKEMGSSPLKKASPAKGLGMARTEAKLATKKSATLPAPGSASRAPAHAPSRLPASMDVPGGFGHAQDPDERSQAATGLLQRKYEQNVKVVEMLFDEKKALEAKIHNLEMRVSVDGSSITGGTFEDQVAAVKQVASPEKMRPQRASSPTSTSRGHKKTSTPTGRTARSMSAGAKRPSPGKAGASSLGAAAAAELFGGKKSAQSLRQSQFVLQLQADSDRYLQKKKGHEETDRQERIEKEQYEKERYRRLVRANKAPPFTGMMERAEKAAEINRERAEKKRREGEEEERKEESMRRKARIDHINKPRSSGELSWKEMEEAAAAQRIERVEKRKVEMSMSSKAPGIGNGSSRRKVAAEKYEPKKVEDPDRVAARLAGQQKKWDAKIEEIKFRNAQKARLARAEIDPKVISMENRIKQGELKRKAREEEKARAREEKEARVEAIKKKELEKLMNQKVPEASRRLTKSSENRAILVRQSMETEMRKVAADEKAERHRKNKLKVMGSVMKNVVEEREQFRKSQHPDYIELAGSEERASAIAREKRDEFRLKLRENKAKLVVARERAPSLMERMDMTTAVAAAGNNALTTLKDTMTKGMANDGDCDDLFDDYEKLKLGL